MEFKSSPFMETLYLLRTIEQIILYNKVMEISDTETQDAATFLEEEYQKETLKNLKIFNLLSGHKLRKQNFKIPNHLGFHKSIRAPCEKYLFCFEERI